MKKIILKTEADTAKLAQSIAKKLKGGEILALSGDLGAGKTTFTQYLAKAIGVKVHVNSPTFVIMRIYKTSKHPFQNLAHIDAYRLDSEQELEYLGLDQYLGQSTAITVIEWAEKMEEYLKSKKNVVKIHFELHNDKRIVQM